MSSLARTVFRRYVSTSVNNLKKESRPHITKPWAKPVLSVKINDIINYFKKPEALKELSEVQYIEKDDLIKSTKSFIRLPGEGKLYYLTIGGERTSKELADLIIKKECFLCLNDAKKRLAIISVECKESYAIQDCTFDTHSIVEQYEVKPFEGIKPPNVEFECIDLVDEIKDMNEILINFVYYKNQISLIRISEEPQIFTAKNTYTPAERKNGVGMLHISKYIHLLDNDIRASLHRIVVESDSSALKEFHNLGLLQVYSQKKQPLIRIDQIIDRLKSGDYGEDFSVKFVDDFLGDPNLRMLSEEKNTSKFQIVESNGECVYTRITNSAENGDLTCKRFQFEEQKEDDSYIIFHVCQVLSTTDLDLKPFEGKALVQRVEENHEIVRETDDVIHFMDAWLPMIKQKRLQLESQPKE